MKPIDTVFLKQRQAATVHVLDGGNVEAGGVACAPGLACRVAQPPHECERSIRIGDWYECQTL